MGDEAACAKRGQAACAKSLPFSVNKNLAVNLSDQLADRLRGAILSGQLMLRQSKAASLNPLQSRMSRRG
jgi:hypothetical protein